MNDSLRYPIAVSVAMGKNRRIRLPKFLSIPVPYVLVENPQPDQLWLAICRLDLLANLMAECDNLRVLAEYRTNRPTLQKFVCNRHGLIERAPIWLVSTKHLVEIFSEPVWNVEMPEFNYP